MGAEAKSEAAPGRRAPAALAAGFALVAFVLGYAQLGVIETGTQSETTTLFEGRALAAGEHRFGIVDYTHYPNGPHYAAALMIRAGLDEREMRLVPLGLAAAGFGAFVFALSAWAGTRGLRAWAVVAAAVLLFQPACLFWMGGLHQHSYAYTMVLLLVATGAWAGPRTTWLLFPLGFVAGWIGYDWVPGQAVAVLAVRWLVLARDPATRLPDALAAAGLDTLKFASGVALAVLLHLGQLVLYFESYEAAARDLLGSAAARANVAGAGELNPDYGRFIERDSSALARAYADRPDLPFGRDFDFGDPSPARLVRVLWAIFARPAWSHFGLLLLATLVGLGLAARHARRAGAAGRRAAVGGVAVALALSAPAWWVFVMPQHALSHLHMIPRHGLVPFTLLLALPVLLAPRAGGDPPPTRVEARPFLLRAAAWAVPLVLVAAAGVHAVVGLG